MALIANNAAILVNVFNSIRTWRKLWPEDERTGAVVLQIVADFVNILLLMLTGLPNLRSFLSNC